MATRRSQRSGGCGWGQVLTVLLGVLAAAQPTARAETNRFTGTGNWSETARWGLTHVPTDAEDVVIDGAATLTNATAVLPSCTVNSGRTLSFDTLGSVLTAAVVVVNGTVTHAINTDTNNCSYTNSAGVWLGSMNARVRIVCSNLTLAAGAKIDGYGKGFQGGSASTVPGAGPGGSLTLGNNASPGAGHIGRGGRADRVRLYGPAYDASNAPAWPGSGSGGGHQNGRGNGGGLVLIDASGHVLLNGSIDVRGTDCTVGGHAGGGSGGGVTLNCLTLGGTNGAILADGGSSLLSGTWWYGGGGSGGGIAVYCDGDAQTNLPAPGVLFSAQGGIGGRGGSPWADDGERGSVYLNHAALLSGLIGGGSYYVSGLTAWNVRTLAITNGWPWFASWPTSITVAGSAFLSGNGTRLDVTNSSFLRVGGNLTLTNGAQLCVYSGPTNETGAGYGFELALGGSLFMGTNTALFLKSDPTNGGSVFIGMSNFTLMAGATVNVEVAGYAGGAGPGKGASANQGGGYGGRGGPASGGGLTYGSSNAPTDPGSGGYGTSGARGGGLVWMQITNIATLNGLIIANGGDGAGNGGGSGGGIYIAADTFATASGTLRANGGSSTAGGGGGGRIALAYRADGFIGTLSVAPGGSGAVTGGVGTIVRRLGAGFYALLVQGSPVPRGVSSPYGYGVNGFGGGATLTNNVNSPANSATGVQYVCTGWTVTNITGDLLGSGGETQAIFTASEDVALTWMWTSQCYLASGTWGPGGSLQSDLSGWYTNGMQATLTAVPSNGYYFLHWMGTNLPAGQLRVNPLTVTVDQPRTIRAVFAATGSQMRVWAGTGSWLDSSLWTPAGVPGTGDTVVVRSGTVTVPYPETMANLTVSNGAALNFAFWDDTEGLSASNVLVYGTVTHAANSAVTNNPLWVPSARVNFTCDSLLVAAGAAINADYQGYRGGGDHAGPGFGPGAGGCISTRGAGGSYGGRGANSGNGSQAGPTYGVSNAPVGPGSGGGGNAMGAQVYAHGGGSVRVQASGTLTIDGTITADGLKGGNDTDMGGGGSGGAIWLSCRTLAGAASGAFRARGGNSTRRDGTHTGGGGGGRIAVDYVFFSYLGTPTPSAYSLSVMGGTNTYLPYSGYDGGTGTVYWNQMGSGFLTLRTQGSPAMHGTVSPYNYGEVGVPGGEEVTESVNSPADTADGVRYACLGWTLTNGRGTLVGSGVTTQAVFTMSTNLFLTWFWTNEFYLSTESQPGGSIVTDQTGWYTNGMARSFTAAPAAGYYFSHWNGTNIPAGVRLQPGITVTMDQPRAFRAIFGSTNAGTKVWAGTGNWASDSLWTPPGVPASLDSAIIRSGTVTVSEPQYVADAVVSNGATVLFDNWDTGLNGRDITVHGTLTHDVNMATVTNVAGGWTPDARVYVSCRSFALEGTGSISADARGYRGARDPLCNGTGYGPGGGQGIATRGAGGSHGGRGGGSETGSQPGPTYGVSNAPVEPGSGGGAGGYPVPTLGNGGGAVRIAATRSVRIDGPVSADGQYGGPETELSGGGAGGSIYITARSFTGGAGGVLRARGGAGTTRDGGATGGGGGGRIAVSAIGVDFLGTPVPGNDGTVVNGGTNTFVSTYSGAKGTVVWIRPPVQGTVFLVR